MSSVTSVLANTLQYSVTMCFNFAENCEHPSGMNFDFGCCNDATCPCNRETQCGREPAEENVNLIADDFVN